MSTASERPTHCPRCGQKLSPTVGECFFCDPAEPAVAPSPRPRARDPLASPVTPPASSSGAAADPARDFGLLLFEAEEALARGQGDKALVLASRAVKEKPDSLTALALYERARRDVLRGRRREKLESRITEGRRLFEQGHLAEASRIVTSALKLLPDHPLAQYLHAQLKHRRVGASTAEADAERELDRMAHAEAHRAAQAARAALANGWHRRALVAVRRGLRVRPDDPELLEVLREVQRSDDRIEHETARRRAVMNRVRAALDLLGQHRLEESLKILRGVLREEPHDARAQAAVQEVRKAWLRRVAAQETQPVPAEARSEAARPSSPPVTAPPDATAARRMTAARTVAGTGRTIPGVHVQRPESIPSEILLPRSRRRSTPLVLVLAGAAVAATLFYILGASDGDAPTAPHPAPPRAATQAAAPREAAPGPLDGVEASLRQAIEATLADYARALETRDESLLARARPDLSPAERSARLAPFAGAINVASDLRVLDVVPEAGGAAVPVLRTDVIVGGNAGPTSPVEEVLHFRRHEGGWVIRAGRR